MTRLRVGRGRWACRPLMVALLLLVPVGVLANDEPLHRVQSGVELPQLLPIATKGVNPFDPIALNNKAVEQMEKRDYRAALILLDRAVRLAPHHFEIRKNYQQLKRWLQAGGGADSGLGASTSSGAARSAPAATSDKVLPPEPPAPWR